MGRFGEGVSYPNILRGTDQQTESNLVYLPPNERLVYSGYRDPSVAQAAPVSRRMTGIVIRSFELNNRTAGAAVAGLGFRLANRFWKVGRLAAGVFTDVTTAAQGTTSTFTLGVNADNIPVIILSPFKFGWFSINVTTAEVDAGAAVDHTVDFSNFAGTDFFTPTAAEIFYTDTATRTNAVWPTGELRAVWKPPANWGKVTNITGLESGVYAVRLSTAQIGVGDTAAIATGMEVGMMPLIADSPATNTIYSGEDVMVPNYYADAVVALFSVADAGNGVYVEAYPHG